jgi:hypothetical protein
LFSRPTALEHGEAAVKNYEKCKSYILENPKYPNARFDSSRQIRTHSCFSYCTNGKDNSVLGEDRRECVDLAPPLRDQIVCIMPTDACEKTSVAGEIFLTADRDPNYTFSLTSAIIAMVVANPLQFVFDLLCIYLQKYKIN